MRNTFTLKFFHKRTWGDAVVTCGETVSEVGDPLIENDFSLHQSVWFLGVSIRENGSMDPPFELFVPRPSLLLLILVRRPVS